MSENERIEARGEELPVVELSETELEDVSGGTGTGTALIGPAIIVGIVLPQPLPETTTTTTRES